MAVIHVKAHDEKVKGKVIHHKAYSYTSKGGGGKAKKARKSKKSKK